MYFGLLHGTTDVAIKVVTTPTPAQQKSFVKETMILKVRLLGDPYAAVLMVALQPNYSYLQIVYNKYEQYKTVGKRTFYIQRNQ